MPTLLESEGMYWHVLCVLKISTYRTRLIHALYMSRESEIFLMTLWLLLAASLMNSHEDIRNRPSSWIVVAFLPSLDADVSVQWDKAGGNSTAVHNTEIALHAWDALFEEFNEFSQQPRPMEWPDGQIAMTHALYFGSIVDKQEQDRLMADPGSCHTCHCPSEHYLSAEKYFPAKLSREVLGKVMEAASTVVNGKSIVGRDEDGHRHWNGTQDKYTELRKAAGGSHLLYNPFHHIIFPTAISR